MYAYNTNDWQNFYYPNNNYLEELPTGIPRTFPIYVCIDPKMSNRRKYLIRQAMDIWNKAYKDHVSQLIKEGVLYESDLGENIPDYQLLRILFNLDGSDECPTDHFYYRMNFRWRERYLFITESKFTEYTEEAERKRIAGKHKPDHYLEFFQKEYLIRINPAVNLYDGEASYKKGELFFITVVIHELGHTIGIAHHTNKSNPLMYEYNNFIRNKVYRPTKEDIEILLSLHIDLAYRRRKPSPFHGCWRGIKRIVRDPHFAYTPLVAKGRYGKIHKFREKALLSIKLSISVI